MNNEDEEEEVKEGIEEQEHYRKKRESRKGKGNKRPKIEEKNVGRIFAEQHKGKK